MNMRALTQSFYSIRFFHVDPLLAVQKHTQLKTLFFVYFDENYFLNSFTVIKFFFIFEKAEFCSRKLFFEASKIIKF